jgi:hypothetical protein
MGCSHHVNPRLRAGGHDLLPLHQRRRVSPPRPAPAQFVHSLSLSSSRARSRQRCKRLSPNPGSGLPSLKTQPPSPLSTQALNGDRCCQLRLRVRELLHRQLLGPSGARVTAGRQVGDQDPGQGPDAAQPVHRRGVAHARHRRSARARVGHQQPLALGGQLQPGT